MGERLFLNQPQLSRTTEVHAGRYFFGRLILLLMLSGPSSESLAQNEDQSALQGDAVGETSQPAESIGSRLESESVGSESETIRRQLEQTSTTKLQPMTVDSDPTGGKGIDAFNRCWAEWLDAWRARQPELIDRLNEQLREQQLLVQLTRLEAHSSALLRFANELIDRGDAEAAGRLAQLAVDLSPTTPEVRVEAARVALRHNWAATPAFINALVTAPLAARNDPEQLLKIGINLLGRLASAFLAVIIIGAILMFLKHLRRFVYLIQRRLPSGWSVLLAWGMTGLLLCVPVMLALPPFWWILFWFVLFWRLMASAERLIGFCAIGLLLIVAPLSDLLSRWIAAPSQANRALIELDQGEPLVRGNLDPLTVVSTDIREPAFALEKAFVLGRAYKRRGQLEKAEENYRQVISANDRLLRARAFNNLGNIAMVRGQAAEAAQFYREAIGLDPRLILPHYNLGVLLQSQFRLGEADAEFEQVKSQDADFISKQLVLDARFSVRHPNIDLVDYALGAGRLLSIVGRAHSSQSAIGEALWNRYAGLVDLRDAGQFGFGLLLLFSVMTIHARRLPRIEACHRCADPLTGQDGFVQNGRRFCPICYHLLVVGEGVEPSTRVQREIQLRRRNGRRHAWATLLSLLLPGAVHWQRGNYWRGLLLMFLFLWGYGQLMAPMGLVRSDVVVTAGLQPYQIVLISLLLGPFYLSSVLANRDR